MSEHRSTRENPIDARELLDATDGSDRGSAWNWRCGGARQQEER
ncbi:MAG: hypothetical protein ABI634_18670 [Acidobacteriota bacterium]